MSCTGRSPSLPPSLPLHLSPFRSSPGSAEDRSGVKVRIGIARKVTPYNSTDTEGEEAEVTGSFEEFELDVPILMTVIKDVNCHKIKFNVLSDFTL